MNKDNCQLGASDRDDVAVARLSGLVFLLIGEPHLGTTADHYVEKHCGSALSLSKHSLFLVLNHPRSDTVHGELQVQSSSEILFDPGINDRVD